MKLDERVKSRLRGLIAMGDKVKATGIVDGIVIPSKVDRVLLVQWQTSAINLLESAFGEHSPQYKRAVASTTRELSELAGMLHATLDDINVGAFFRARDLIDAEIAEDYLGQADTLLAANYKDAAAVIAGGVLERHLRTLCASRQPPIPVTTEKGAPIKLDAINAQLANAGAYNKLKQKQVTAWSDIRNNAAHGDYDKYTASNVEALIRDVRGFCADVS